MQREIKYKCEYCGLRLANRLKMAEHEKLCREETSTQNRIISLFEGLFYHYCKLGWRISIACNDDEIYE